jgi:hypothetical protein
MDREITRANVRDVDPPGLEEARGNYKIVAQALQHGVNRDYKRVFLITILRTHDVPDLPFKEYR